MKKVNKIILINLLLALAIITSVAMLSVSDKRLSRENMDFVKVSNKNPSYFELKGKPFIPIGLNVSFIRFTENEEEVFQQYEEYFKALSENKGNFARIWLSAPFFEIEHNAAGQYDENKAKRIDKVIELAKKYKIRLKLTIHHFRTFEESPAKFPGSVPFGKSIYNIKNGGPFDNITEFFSSEKGEALFLKKLDFFSRRYKDEPTIFGWELWNEINSVKGDGWIEWTDKMLAELKKRFPNSIVMQSMGSFDNEASRTFYEEICKFESNEVAQIHRYLDLGAQLDVCKGPVDVLASDAIEELRSYNVNKPLILAESGAVEPHHAGPFKNYDKDTSGIILHDVLFAPFFSGAAGPGQIWHWDFYVKQNNLWYHYNRFAEAIKDINPLDENFKPVKFESQNVRIYALIGKKTFIAWCRDKNSDWQTAIEQGKKPEEYKKLQIDLSNQVQQKAAKVHIYDPWKDKWTTANLQKGRITIPEFQKSAIIKITIEQ